MKTDNAYALHIAFFLHDLRGGGVERITIHLANEMCRMGCKIDLVLINKIGEQAYFRSIDSSVSIIELPQKRTLTSCVGFRTYIRKHQPNIVVSALTHINVSTLLSVSFLKKKPYIFVVEHNHRIGRQKNGSLEDLGTAIRLAFRLVPYLYPRANTVGVVSDGIRSALAAAIPVPKEQITLLHNPVTAPDSKGLPEACTVLPWLAQSNVPFILGVGSLSYEKSFDLLIEAFARVRRNRPLRLVIAGEGPKRLELEEKAQDCGFQDDIHLPGFVNNPYALMRDARLLALTSRWEGLPTVLIEAMMLGTSVVATDCPSGPAEILLGGSIGCLVPPGDADALADAIEKTLEVPQHPHELIERALEFSPEAAAQRYLDAYYRS